MVVRKSDSGQHLSSSIRKAWERIIYNMLVEYSWSGWIWSYRLVVRPLSNFSKLPSRKSGSLINDVPKSCLSACFLPSSRSFSAITSCTASNTNLSSIFRRKRTCLIPPSRYGFAQSASWGNGEIPERYFSNITHRHSIPNEKTSIFRAEAAEYPRWWYSGAAHGCDIGT